MKLAMNMTDTLLKDKIIPSEETEIIRYGLETLGGNLLGVLITLSIGSCFGYAVDSLILYLLLFPLRKYAGGYHADTRARCLLISTGMLVTAAVCFWYCHCSILVCSVITMGMFGLIYLIAPIENHSKRLEMIEHKVYRRRTRVILILEGILYVLAVAFQIEWLSTVITMGYCIVGISLVAGWMKLQLHNATVLRNRKT